MLRKTSAITILLLLFIAPAFGWQQSPARQSPLPPRIQPSPEWATFNSPEGRFSILTPAKPEPEVKEIDSAVGKLTLYTYSSSSPVAYFMVSYGDYPIEAADDRRDAVLDGVRGGITKGSQAELVSEKSITISANRGGAGTSDAANYPVNYPGREFLARRTIEGSEVIFTWRIYLVGRRLYQMAVGVTKANSAVPDIQKFLTSFQLTN